MAIQHHGDELMNSQTITQTRPRYILLKQNRMESFENFESGEIEALFPFTRAFSGYFWFSFSKIYNS